MYLYLFYNRSIFNLLDRFRCIATLAVKVRLSWRLLRRPLPCIWGARWGGCTTLWRPEINAFKSGGCPINITATFSQSASTSWNTILRWHCECDVYCYMYSASASASARRYSTAHTKSKHRPLWPRSLGLGLSHWEGPRPSDRGHRGVWSKHSHRPTYL